MLIAKIISDKKMRKLGILISLLPFFHLSIVIGGQDIIMGEGFACALCAKRFTSAIDREKHMNEVHPDGESVVNMQPENSDEQSVSGSTPDPESDDDTLDNAHDVGEQTNENEEHPKEVDLGRDIDKSEGRIRTH